MDQPENNIPQESLVRNPHDRLLRGLNQAVIIAVKVLAIIMVLVIWLSLVDVIIHFYKEIVSEPFLLVSTEHLITTLGDFLAVLIAIEIFLNIVFYLNKDAIHVPLVLATALTAVARKVIVLDYKATPPLHIFALAAIIIAVGISYWLSTRK
jgi:uncharacterized membrane protein (DUF373 family)